MANIMITEACNLRCPYCFANEFTDLRNKPANIMSLENFNKAVEFALTEPNEPIGIIGGEPTLHPQFKEIMETIIFDNRINFATLFTNGTHLKDYYNLLTNNKIYMLINCNSPNDTGQAQYDELIENLDVLINKYYMKGKISIGINMYKEDFDYSYILDILYRFKFNHVRTSIAVPNSDDKKQVDTLEYFKGLKNSVYRFFKELQKINVMPTYDCNVMPTCIPSFEENEWLKGFWKLEEKSNGYCNVADCSSCLPVIDILPDLNAVRCFGLSKNHKVHISKFKSIKEIRNYYYNLFDAYAYNIFSSSDCEMCELRQKMECSGGCLAFKVNRIDKARKYCNEL